MRIKYEFCTENVEIEVSDYWASVLRKLDRDEYNINQRETRRHFSLYTKDHRLSRMFVDTCFEDRIISKLDAQRLHDAILCLSPRHQYLIEQVYLKQRSYAEIAREKGVQTSSVMRTTKYALEKLKTICELMQF